MIFPYEPSLKVIYDDELPYDMRSYFIELFLNMYLDREPLEPLQIPALTMVQSEIPDFRGLILMNDKGYTI